MAMRPTHRLLDVDVVDQWIVPVQGVFNDPFQTAVFFMAYKWGVGNYLLTFLP